MNRYFFLSLLIITASCSEPSEPFGQSDTYQVTDTISQPSSPVRSYKVIFTENVGWGYQIFEGSKMMVDQKHIPAVQGMVGFDSKEKAEITAKFILDKIEQGIFPPTVSPEELDSLGVYTIPVDQRSEDTDQQDQNSPVLSTPENKK